MKSHLQTYLLLLVICSSLVPALAQLRGKAISRTQILMYNMETGVFELKDVHYPNEKEYNSAKVLASQLNPSKFFCGSILSESGTNRRSGQILYKINDRFALVSYKRQKVFKPNIRNSGRWVAQSSEVSFKFKNGFAVSILDQPVGICFDESDSDFFSRTGFYSLWEERFTQHTISPKAQNDYEVVLRIVGLSKTISDALVGSVFEQFLIDLQEEVPYDLSNSDWNFYMRTMEFLDSAINKKIGDLAAAKLRKHNSPGDRKFLENIKNKHHDLAAGWRARFNCVQHHMELSSNNKEYNMVITNNCDRSILFRWKAEARIPSWRENVVKPKQNYQESIGFEDNGCNGEYISKVKYDD